MNAARLTTLFAVLAAAATLVSGAASADVPAPGGLHGFMLRADEPLTENFHRTPSFAWNPVPGARTYQFQLSTSSTFRDTGTLYDDKSLTTPVAAPPLTLPWITGNPHALYARVRAVLDNTTTQWSTPFGFDVTPPAAPVPLLPSYSGLLRWAPVEGAGAYQVWLVDTGKMEIVRTNVLDEREFYTFHQTPDWTGTVRWRIRALRNDVFNYRINGVPVTQYGPWSPVYSSSNTPVVSDAPIRLTGTVSDVFSDGSNSSPAHQYMPAFTWTGDQSLSGEEAELYRVYIFTDKSCLNRVYSSAVVGSQTWSPRLGGPLALPTDDNSTTAARSGYLGDGKETSNLTADFEIVKNGPNEQWASATATTGVPGELPAATGTTPPPDPTGGAAPAPGGGGSSNISVTGDVGPPIDLWDTNWPASGYYWTVIPVVQQGLGLTGTAVAPPGSLKGAVSVPVTTTTGFRVGDTVSIGDTPTTSDSAQIISIGSGSLTLATKTQFVHGAGEAVNRAGGSIIYQDLELPQEVCAAGRVQRFGIESEPSLTAGSAPFATGLAPNGRLTSAAKTPSFYGSPLVAWTPAFGADIYEIQYSKSQYPFNPEIDPRSKTTGMLTFSTADVLPFLKGAMAGTWWYRVRGIDFNLPTGVQQMGWSDPEKLVVTAPKFTIAKTVKKKFKIVGP